MTKTKTRPCDGWQVILYVSGEHYGFIVAKNEADAKRIAGEMAPVYEVRVLPPLKRPGNPA